MEGDHSRYVPYSKKGKHLIYKIKGLFLYYHVLPSYLNLLYTNMFMVLYTRKSVYIRMVFVQSTNLCNIAQCIAENLDNKCQVDVIYTDFTKAFDKVSHSILLSKLKNEFGFHGNLVTFSYLRNRKQHR